MGLGQLFHRDVEYVATDTDTGQSQTFTIVDNLLPSWSSGAYSGAMSIPSAWRAAILLSDLIGGVPWHAYRERVGRPAQRIEPTPPLLDRPSYPDVRVTTFSSMTLDYLWHGNAVAVIASRNREGWPTAILPVSATQVQVKRVTKYDNAPLPVGSIGYMIGGPSGAYAGTPYSGKWYDPHDVIHVKAPCEPGALRGLGVLENHLNGGSLELAAEQNRHARSLSGSGIPTGVLQSDDPDLTQEDADAHKAAWLRAQRDRTVAVLNPNVHFTPVAWNPSETQLLDARRFSDVQIAQMFGLDPSWVGAQQSSRVYTNIEQEGLTLLKFSLGGILARFEQTFSAHMPRGTWAQANLDALLRTDTLTRYQAHQIGISAGFLTADEARELEDRPPLTAAQRAALAPPTPVAPAPADKAVQA